MRRLEHEVRLPPQRGQPVLNPQRHACTKVVALLMRVLTEAQATCAELRTFYQTDVRCLYCSIRQGARPSAGR